MGRSRQRGRTDSGASIELHQGLSGDASAICIWQWWAAPPVRLSLVGEDGSELEPIEGGPHDPLRSGVEIDPKIISLETQQSGKWMPIQKNCLNIRANFDRISTLAKNKTRPRSRPDRLIHEDARSWLCCAGRRGSAPQQAAGLLDQASVWLPRLQGGQGFSCPNVRQMYVDAARSMFGSYEKTYQGLARDTQSRALQYGLSTGPYHARLRRSCTHEQGSSQSGDAARHPRLRQEVLKR